MPKYAIRSHLRKENGLPAYKVKQPMDNFFAPSAYSYTSSRGHIVSRLAVPSSISAMATEACS